MVIHAAARAHIMTREKNACNSYERINTKGSLTLASLAKEAGIKRFIFLSTIKVNGESTQAGCPFQADDVVNPGDPYSLSKYEAEKRLLQLTGQMDLVILRLPLVYGAGVKGNFLSLLQSLATGRPLPLGAVKKNKRSLLSIENLMSFIDLCLDNPLAANQIFLLSDNEDLSTTELIKLLRATFKKKSFLLPLPCWMLKWAAAGLGKREQFFRLASSLQVDIRKAQQLLDWKPQVSVKEALANTVIDYLEKHSL